MKDYIEIMRPTYWSKNVFVFAALVFGGKLVGEPNVVLLDCMSALAGFLCFCMAASAVYIFNDIVDRKDDRNHQQKSQRPIAAGRVSVSHGLFLSVVCATAAVVCSFLLVKSLAVIIISYIVLMVLYSLLLKGFLIVDAITIAIGFVLRAMAGAVVTGVAASSWLIICTFALCLFMGFGKQRCEMAQISADAHGREVKSDGYTLELLGHMLNVTAGLAIMCFLMYSLDDRTIGLFGTTSFIYTMPFVLYCIFRFSALVQKGVYVEPVQIILHDGPFRIGLALWLWSCAIMLYASKLGLNPAGILVY